MLQLPLLLTRCRLCCVPSCLSRGVLGPRFASDHGFHHDYTPPQALRAKKPRKPTSENERPFIDYKEVTVEAGKGGDGCLSFLRLPQNEWAGPDGGDGGNGGHVVIEASRNCKSLGHVKSLVYGRNGTDGRNNNRHGRNAEHFTLKVPVGTVVKTDELETVGSLLKEGQYVLAARGGAGGKGNRFFLSNEERAPACAETGAAGQKRSLVLEMTALAHVGLIGFPNAGKSTLLRALSRARPRVAAFPFTTLSPHIGVIEYDDYVQVAVADIPGLIEGAHLNKGLGHAFLRHIERCACLLYVVDLTGHRCWTQLTALRAELEHYQPGLAARPHAVVANKTDVPWAARNLESLTEWLRAEGELRHTPVFAVSAKMKDGIRPLVQHIRSLYDNSSSSGSDAWDGRHGDDDDDDDGYGSGGGGG
ncbi:mitochondrial ribosome-associated GTPase 2-like, partial [Argonauta hians]